MKRKMIDRIEAVLTAFCLACALALLLFLACGCTTVCINNRTADGREFNAYAWSFLWDRNLSGLKFNYEKGTLDLDTLKTTPDKETIAKGLEMMATGLQLMKTAL